MKNLHQIKYLYIPARGVITKGRPILSDILPSPKMPYSAVHLLHITASAMAQSKHPLADVICNYAEERSIPYDIYSKTFYDPGLGVEAEVSGMNLLVGGRRFMEQKLVRIDALQQQAEALCGSGKTILYIAAENTVAGIIAFTDSLKEGIETLVENLHRQGVTVVLLSDDHSLSAKNMAEFAGIERFTAELTPQEARGHMQRYRTENSRIAAISPSGDFAESFTDADFLFNTLEEFIEELGILGRQILHGKNWFTDL